MPELFHYNSDRPERTYVPVYIQQRKKYGFFHFFFDCALVMITGGLWLIWIFVREMRKR